MARVYVGNLDPRVSEIEIEDEFKYYGILRSVWVARRPPGYAFIEFDDLKCYECGESGHFARECRSRGGGGRGLASQRHQSPSPRRRSPSPQRRRSPSYGRRSPSPLKRSPPRRRSISPRRGRSLSRSPPYGTARRDSPYANGD